MVGIVIQSKKLSTRDALPPRGMKQDKFFANFHEIVESKVKLGLTHPFLGVSVYSFLILYTV